MSRTTRIAISALLLGCLIGGAIQRYGVLGRIRRAFVAEKHVAALPPVVRREVPRSILDGKRVFVAVCFGQSNAANSGEVRTKSAGLVLNYSLGKLYAAEDPMIGAVGDGGSPWPRLGDLLIESGQCEAVVFATLAVPASGIARWAPFGDLHGMLIYTLRDLRTAGLEPTHMLWHQGESDRQTPPDDYRRMLLAMIQAIRDDRFEAPIFVSVATWDGQGFATGIQRVQREVVGTLGIRAGPDTDQLGKEYRYDGVHWSRAGLDRCSQLWLEALH